ncbi:MAG: stage III sporulation protein AE [Eubacteriales bacterium]|nr:stage III sporulation protein AE [Eubacteriales bacterium]
MRKGTLVWGVLVCLLLVLMGREKAWASGENSWSEELLGDMELEEVQKWVDAMLPGEGLSIEEAVKKLMNGEELFSKERIFSLVREVFFGKLEQEKKLLGQILLLILAAAVFYNLAQVFENSQIGEVSFYVIYLVLFLLLVQSFGEFAGELEKQLETITGFMKGLAPAYYLAVAAAGGGGSALAFYQMVLFLIWLIQWLIGKLILPGTNLYVLLCMVNHLSKEEMLTGFSELLKSLISWGLKTLLGIVTGMQVIKGLVAPVMDSLKRSLLGRTAGAIPGVGNAVNTVTEIVITSAVLVRNCMGVAFLVILVMWGMRPVIHYGMMSLFYKLSAALGEPVSDKRLVGALSTMGEGMGLLLHIFLTVQVLCMLTVVILAVSFGG